MNMQDHVSMAAGALIVLFIFFLLILVKNLQLMRNKKTSDKLACLKKAAKRKNILITNLNLQENNSWEDPQIQLWMSNPVGYGRRDVDEKLPLEGKIVDPPKEGFVRIFIILVRPAKPPGFSLGMNWPSRQCERLIWYNSFYEISKKSAQHI